MTIRLATGNWRRRVRDGSRRRPRQNTKKLHPNVRIVQEAIPESTYGQWMSTQLMGGTAPDIVQAGMVEGHLMTAFFTRYFLPLSRYVTRPNPYNAGNRSRKRSLIRTFKDGMRRSFIDETQEFMTIPLALTGVRLFYNKPLLKKLTGLDEAPTDYRAFLEVCEKIRAQKQPNGQPYVAIAGSRFHYMRWEESLIKPLTYLAAREIDFNRDGRFSKEEMFLGFASGKISFANPAYEASFKMVREITEEFPERLVRADSRRSPFQFCAAKGGLPCDGHLRGRGNKRAGRRKIRARPHGFSACPRSLTPTSGQSFKVLATKILRAQCRWR